MNSNTPPNLNPQLWIDAAESDLSFARAGKTLNGIRYDELCYHCMQAAEKSLKALMVKKFNDFEKGHDLEKLISFLEAKGLVVPLEIKCAVSDPIDYGQFQFPFEFPLSFEKGSISLSDLEKTRYPPGKHRRSMNIVAYSKALERAELVVKWVKEQI
jgi:HEPN domain-containing protein